jgi:hypothetical protein
MKREEPFILVPATYRERKDFWQTKAPRTRAEIQEIEKAADQRKREAEQRAAEVINADEEDFQLRKQQAESEYRQRKNGGNHEQL